MGVALLQPVSTVFDNPAVGGTVPKLPARKAGPVGITKIERTPLDHPYLTVTLSDGRKLEGVGKLESVHHTDGIKFIMPGGPFKDLRTAEQRRKFNASEHLRFCKQEEAREAAAYAARLERERNLQPATGNTSPTAGSTRQQGIRSEAMSKNVKLNADTATSTATTEKPAKAKKAHKPAKKAAAKPSSNGELTGKEVGILTMLNKHKQPVSRKVLEEKCGASSAVLGAGSKEGLGKQGGGLEGKGYIESMRIPEERMLHYTITPKGKTALAKAE